MADALAARSGCWRFMIGATSPCPFRCALASTAWMHAHPLALCHTACAHPRACTHHAHQPHRCAAASQISATSSATCFGGRAAQTWSSSTAARSGAQRARAWRHLGVHEPMQHKFPNHEGTHAATCTCVGMLTRVRTPARARARARMCGSMHVCMCMPKHTQRIHSGMCARVNTQQITSTSTHRKAHAPAVCTCSSCRPQKLPQHPIVPCAPPPAGLTSSTPLVTSPCETWSTFCPCWTRRWW